MVYVTDKKNVDKIYNMQKIQILMIGRDPVVIQKLLRFINDHPEWEGTGTVDDKSAVTLFSQMLFHYVILVDSFPEASLELFYREFKNLKPDVVFLRHYGDSTALLASELDDLMESHPVQLDKEEA